MLSVWTGAASDRARVGRRGRWCPDDPPRPAARAGRGALAPGIRRRRLGGACRRARSSVTVNADAPEIRAQVTDEPRATAPRRGRAPAAAAPSTDGARPLRRGLPRTWAVTRGRPPGSRRSSARKWQHRSPPRRLPARRDTFAPAADADVVVPVASAPLTGHEVTLSRADAATDLSVPLPFTRTVYPAEPRAPAPHRARTCADRPVHETPVGGGRDRWRGRAAVRGGDGRGRGAFPAEPGAVPGLPDHLSGEYELPEGAPVGFPAWLGWQHFFQRVPDGADHPHRPAGAP